jgi:hypothetical protein
MILIAFLAEIACLKLRIHEIAFAPFFGLQKFAPPPPGPSFRLRMIGIESVCGQSWQVYVVGQGNAGSSGSGGASPYVSRSVEFSRVTRFINSDADLPSRTR